MKKKILLFDFDKTLTKKDSIVILWEYAIKTKKVSRLKYIKTVLVASLKLIASTDFRVFKSKMCSIFEFFNDKELEDFVDYVYENYMLKDGLDFLKNESRDYAMLVSASPINYLKFFKKYLDFDVFIGTELNEDFTLKGQNNRQYEKVRRIKNHLRKMDIEIDFEKSAGFSDSYKSDMPMLEMVKNKYLINSKKNIKGYNNLSWK